MRRRLLAGAVETPRRRLEQRVDQEGRLAAAGHAGDAGEQADGNIGRDVLEIVGPRTDDADVLVLLRLAALVRQGDGERAGKVLAGEAGGVGHDLGRRALGNDLATVNAGTGADIQHVVGGEDGVLVMFDDDHRVAEVAQMLQRFDQLVVVALVQADGRLVEHIEDTGETRTDLAGQTDTLALAARQGAGRTRQRQVLKADVVEEAQAFANFLQDADADFVLLGGEMVRQGREPRTRLADRHLGDLTDMQAGDLHGERFRLQAVAVAGLARVIRLEASQPPRAPYRSRFPSSGARCCRPRPRTASWWCRF